MRTVKIDDLEFKATLIGANSDAGRIVLKCNDQAVLRALAESEEPPLIGGDGVAVSPLPAFPGEIQFPQYPAGREFKAMHAALPPREGDPRTDRAREVLPYWRAAVAIADGLSIQTPQGQTITEETDEDDVPAAVMHWIAACMREYDENFLRGGL